MRVSLDSPEDALEKEKRPPPDANLTVAAYKKLKN